MRLSILAAALVLTTAVFAQNTTPPSITTKGTAHVYAVPDEVVIDVHLKNENDDLQMASDLTDKQARTILALCKEFDIRPEHAQSRYRRYGKNWRYKDGRPKYEASQTINICLKDLARYDEFMKAIIAIEVQSVSGTTFRTTKHREHMDQARKKAIKAAKEKAQLLAGELDQEVGQALHIREANVTHRWGNTNAYANVHESTGGDTAASDGTAFAPGQIKIEAEVEVSFALK